MERQGSSGHGGLRAMRWVSLNRISFKRSSTVPLPPMIAGQENAKSCLAFHSIAVFRLGARSCRRKANKPK